VCVTECCALLARVSPAYKRPWTLPFIVEGRHSGGTYICYVAFFGRGGMAEPYSLSLWRRGWWSGLVRALQLVTVAAWSVERSCPSPVAHHCCGVVGGAVLSSVH